MGRLLIIVVMLIISGVIYLIKAGVGKVTGTEVNFKDESQKVMNTTAKGINWMNDQWDKAKASTNTQYLTTSGFSNMSATEIIATVKVNSTKYDKASAEAIYIEQAVAKMNNRQYDDAKKLIMQVSEGEGRDYMLNEIEQKRNG